MTCDEYRAAKDAVNEYAQVTDSLFLALFLHLRECPECSVAAAANFEQWERDHPDEVAELSAATDRRLDAIPPYSGVQEEELYAESLEAFHPCLAVQGRPGGQAAAVNLLPVLEGSGSSPCRGLLARWRASIDRELSANLRSIPRGAGKHLERINALGSRGQHKMPFVGRRCRTAF
jgi:hypothetical protein